MKRAGPVAFGPAAITVLLTCPAGHKYEVIYGIVQGGVAANSFFGFLLHAAGGYTWAAVEANPPQGNTTQPFGPVVVLPGEEFAAYGSHGVGGTALQAWCTYIDVF
jgi:hypothetical protein